MDIAEKSPEKATPEVSKDDSMDTRPKDKVATETDSVAKETSGGNDNKNGEGDINKVETGADAWNSEGIDLGANVTSQYDCN